MDDSTAHEEVDELVSVIGLSSLEQLLSQHDGAANHVHHVAVEQGDVLGFPGSRDQREEVPTGAYAAIIVALASFVRDVDLAQIGAGC